MAKKIDLKRTLGNPTPSFDVNAIEEMTRMIHQPKATTPPVVEEKKQVIVEEKKPLPKTEKKETTASKKIVAEKIEDKAEQKVVEKKEAAKRGRKPSPPATDERMIRVSVDLPESLFIQLKTKVIMDRTDMKTFVWRLVERELGK